tara:strand:+ start:193 stop:558 length:366 start_codon:yes stop_codon:yes gene_type:complete
METIRPPVDADGKTVSVAEMMRQASLREEITEKAVGYQYQTRSVINNGSTKQTKVETETDQTEVDYDGRLEILISPTGRAYTPKKRRSIRLHGASTGSAGRGNMRRGHISLSGKKKKGKKK